MVLPFHATRLGRSSQDEDFTAGLRDEPHAPQSMRAAESRRNANAPGSNRADHVAPLDTGG
jgi:hypothetical protein